MKNVLMFAGIAGLAAAIAIYFTTESTKSSGRSGYVTDADIEDYEIKENTGEAIPDKGFYAM
jgi:hypothetical protein